MAVQPISRRSGIFPACLKEPSQTAVFSPKCRGSTAREVGAAFTVMVAECACDRDRIARTDQTITRVNVLESTTSSMKIASAAVVLQAVYVKSTGAPHDRTVLSNGGRMAQPGAQERAFGAAPRNLKVG